MRVKTKYIYYLLIFLFGTLNYGYSQDANTEVKRLQRAIFIFNFAEQVTWEKPLNNDFTIGVLGPDNTIKDIERLAKKRKIKTKPVNVKQLQSIRDIKGVQLVFVNKRYNFDVNYLLNKISNQQVLLVTEDYNYNSSMINIVNVDNSFAYEINEQLLAKEQFKVAPTLRQYAISSSEKWKQLYQSTEKELDKIEEAKQQQDVVIEDKEKQIQSQKQEITVQKEEITVQNESIQQQTQAIEKLFDETEFQKKKYKEKLLIEQQLEERIKHQLDSIKIQENNIETINTEIEVQQAKLKKQEDDIAIKEAILKEKDSKLNTQKTINYLLFALFGLALLSSFLIYKGYASVKKLNATLGLKNEEIHKQSRLLESKNKELEEFAYITSHDLKEPLATISTFANSLEDDYSETLDDDALTILGFINKACNRGLNFIDALLKYSHLGKSDKTLVNCNDLIGDIKTDLSSIIERNSASIISENLPSVNASVVELRLLFQNLINNAVKFKKPNTNPIIRIDSQKIISTKHHSEFWQFSVSDNGIGIAEKHKERIFAMFQRLHTTKYEGNGIGLAYCKKIVESLGGEIWFDSEDGKGTTFHFTIPA